VFTQDLDFSSALAQLKLDRPSVVLLRTRNNEMRAEVADVLWLLRTDSFELEEGALLMIDPASHRVRKLPYD
jgi:predicted nuclease of predicted toxin-antitoxin system